jgi:hypothetical protein
MVVVRPGSGGHVLLEGEALYEVDEDLLLGVLLKQEPQPTAAHLIDPNTKECTRCGMTKKEIIMQGGLQVCKKE